MSELGELGARDAALRLAAGEVTAEAYTQACLDATAAHDDTVKAWAYLDEEFALGQARALDAHREAGSPLGPLHGVPVGVKDIIDTQGVPTENGTVLDQGRVPSQDAAVVERLKQAGAVILGKTVTTELAFYHPGKTTNPHDPKRTPGGSSSGSAAGVAAGMMPLSLGTQTNGSVVRPAAFCGVYGLKPSFGRVPRAGALTLSPPLDTIGFFARSLDDIALIGDCAIGYDARDRHSKAYPPPGLRTLLKQDAPVTPSFAFVKTPVWERADEATRNAFDELAGFLGDHCDEVALPEPFNQVHDWLNILMAADFARHLGPYYARGRTELSDVMRETIERGQKISAVDYNTAYDMRGVLAAGLDQIFERYDAIITPAAAGEAPAGLDATGDPSFCTIWTYCGTPALSLPVFDGENGLPMGLQLVGRPGEDGRLLRTARWLIGKLDAESTA